MCNIRRMKVHQSSGRDIAIFDLELSGIVVFDCKLVMTDGRLTVSMPKHTTKVPGQLRRSLAFVDAMLRLEVLRLASAAYKAHGGTALPPQQVDEHAS